MILIISGLIILLLLLLLYVNRPRKEGYFTFYNGMPYIDKTYISTHFVQNAGCGARGPTEDQVYLPELEAERQYI